MRSIDLRQMYSAMRTIAAVLGVAGSLTGCSDLDPVAPPPPIIDPTQLYLQLTLDHPAVNLSTADGYNTIQLTATPRDAHGNAMPDLPAPTFRSTDTSKVRVTANGVVTAVGTVTGAYVIAELTIPGPVKHVDSARINVNTLAPPPELATLSIHPVPPDSAVWPHDLGDLFILATIFGLINMPTVNKVVPRAANTSDVAITGLVIEYTSLDPAIATIDRWTGIATVTRAGQVRMVARTTAYGITKADTATFITTPPLSVEVRLKPGPGGVPAFVPSEIRIAPSGVVVWASVVSDSVDVTFDNPADVGAVPSGICDLLTFFPLILFDYPYPPPDDCGGTGNLLVPAQEFLDPPLDDEDGTFRTMRTRQFLVPGTYPYRSVRTGATGRIVVTTGP